MTLNATVFRDVWADEDWHLIIDDVDVTYWGGVPAGYGGHQLQEPFTYGPASFSFPQISAFDLRTKNTGALHWLNDQKPVRLVKVNNGKRVLVMWRGFITRRNVQDNHVTIDCDGDVSGRLALADEQPTVKWRRKDVGELVWQSFKFANLPFKPRFGPTTGIKLDNQGGDSSALDCVSENLSLAQDLSGTQWTCGVVDDGRRMYHMYEKDKTTVHYTVFLGAEGVTLEVADDLSEKPSRIWGMGEVKGHKWRNKVDPMQERGPAPPFDMPAGQVMQVGTTNADTLSGEGITVLHNRLLNGGFIDREDFGGGVFADDTADAVKKVQRRAELPRTGKVDPDTWDVIWDVRVTGRSHRGAQILPLAQLSRVKEWLRTSTGALWKRNPNWDRDAVPVDMTVEFPPGIHKSRAEKWAEHKVDQADDPNWVGTLALDGADVFQGDVTATTVNPVPISKRDMREGRNVKVVGFDGDTLFHIASLDFSSDGSVRALIDTRARDAMTLAEIRQRNRENRRNPDRKKRLGGKRHRKIEWSEGDGTLDSARSLDADTWNVFQVGAGDEGRIRKLHIELTANTEFAVMVFGDKVTRKMLMYQIGNPLRDTGGKGILRDKGTLEWLEQKHDLCFAAGTFDRPCGYWPGSKLDDHGQPSGDPLTGEFGHRAGFRYATADDPKLYIAIYPTQACKVKAGRILWRGNPDGD